MAGFAEDGGEGGKAQIGFGGEPIGRKNQENLHFPAGGLKRRFSVELNQLFGSAVTLRILDAHALDEPRRKKRPNPLGRKGLGPKNEHCTGGATGEAREVWGWKPGFLR